MEVCNRKGGFELTAPVDYTAWMKERNAYSGNNSFRKVTRLVKYLRDIKETFTCPSVLLTTLLGNQIHWFDKDTLDDDLADYVIVHELLHFSVPNHGKLWKSLMSAHLGDYEKSEKKLKAIGRID